MTTQADRQPPASVPPVALDLADDADAARPYIALVVRAIMDSANPWYLRL
jgi:hypothetical protein